MKTNHAVTKATKTGYTYLSSIRLWKYCVSKRFLFWRDYERQFEEVHQHMPDDSRALKFSCNSVLFYILRGCICHYVVILDHASWKKCSGPTCLTSLRSGETCLKCYWSGQKYLTCFLKWPKMSDILVKWSGKTCLTSFWKGRKCLTSFEVAKNVWHVFWSGQKCLTCFLKWLKMSDIFLK